MRRGLRVLDDLGDLAADEARGFLVGASVGGDVAERAEHEPESAALVPGLLEHPFPLLGAHAERLDVALLETHGDAGVVDLVPVSVEIVAVRRSSAALSS